MATISKLLTVAKEWHNALNSKNKEGMSALVKEDVKIGGPKGEVEGRDAMLEWMDRAYISLTPKRYFVAGNTVIVEALGEWHAPETGEVTGSQVVASVFVIDDGYIESIYRYKDVISAFEVSGIREEDEVRQY